MEMKKQAAKKSLRITVACVLIVALLAGGIWCIQSLSAKYARVVTLNGTVYIETANDSDILLYEHEAKQQADGSYLLAVAAADVTENSYEVLPGVDIPKDPAIYIKNLQDTSYIYIEVCDELTKDDSDAISYELESCWLKLENVTGANGGQIYVYAEDSETATLVTSSSTITSSTGTEQTTVEEHNTTTDPGYDLTLNIIKGQTVTVSSSLPSGEESGTLSFYAYVAQADDGDDATAIFNEFFSSAAAAD